MINTVAVKSLFDRYHKIVKTNPKFYTSARWGVVVVLPKELLDYANKLAGHSGFGAGARPIGIRRAVADPVNYLKKVFESIDTLTAFIESSECDAEEYITEVRARHLGLPTKVKSEKLLSAKEEFWNRYTKQVLVDLVSKYGRSTVQEAYNSLTITEFETRFSLQKELDTLDI